MFCNEFIIHNNCNCDNKFQQMLMLLKFPISHERFLTSTSRRRLPAITITWAEIQLRFNTENCAACGINFGLATSAIIVGAG